MAESKLVTDIAFVIDAGGSLTSVMDEVRKNVRMFCEEVKRGFADSHGWDIALRACLIIYGDYAVEGKNAVRRTPFFNLPEENDKFEEALNAISIRRKLKSPANGAEAVFTAMNDCDWKDINTVYRGKHVIAVFSGAYPLKLQERKYCPSYPADKYPATIEEFERIWIDWDPWYNSSWALDSRKHLIIFAPQGSDENGRSWEPFTFWPRVLVCSSPPSDISDSLDIVIREITRV